MEKNTQESQQKQEEASATQVPAQSGPTFCTKCK